MSDLDRADAIKAYGESVKKALTDAGYPAKADPAQIDKVKVVAILWYLVLLVTMVYGPIAATMAAGMTPPLALFLATLIFKNRFTKDEVEAGKAAGVLGISFITEGAIPFAARDPLRVIPSLMAGSAVAGAISMAAGCLLRAPHGGIFVLFIPNAVTNLPMYVAAIVAGTVVSTLMLGILKKPLGEDGLPLNAARTPVAAD